MPHYTVQPEKVQHSFDRYSEELMTEKNFRQKTGHQQRFGAVAFFESRTDDDEDGEEIVLSLDALSEAFATVEREQQELFIVPVEESVEDTDEPVDGEEDVCDLNPKIILEAMLFVGDRDNRPLSAERAAERMRNVTPEEIDVAVLELNRNYAQFGCPYHIVGDQNGYRMVLRPEFETIQAKFGDKVREATLSQQAIDTLAVVAYRQPICAEEVQKLRKEPCKNTLSLLVRRNLVHVERETRNKKKVSVYRTTERFLKLFNINSLDELPFPEGLE